MENEFQCDEEFLKGLEDIDWEEDWDELREVLGSDSLCCVDAGCKEATTDTQKNDSQSETALVPKQRFTRRVTEDEISRAVQGRVPVNTVKSTIWCTNVFGDWSKERGIQKTLVEMTADEMNQYLSQFVHEAVKQDGSWYPPNSLYQLIAGLQRHLRESGRPEIAFFDERSPVFDKLRKSLDARMKQLAGEGLGMERKTADPITREMEMELWEKGIFSRETGDGLLNIVYFYNCKFFGLRAGDEHRQLKVQQFSFGIMNDTEYVQFTGSTSKTYNGGLKHKKHSPKVLKIYSVQELGERDMVSCYKYYLNLIPGEGPFYRRPCKPLSAESKPSFSKRVVGKNTLNGLVKRFCAEAGFFGNFSGHSGKVTCATELYINEVDEQLIQAQTGHRSTSSVRCYKRTQEDHILKVSRILQPPPIKKSSSCEYDEKERDHDDDAEKENIQPQTTEKKETAAEPNVTTGASLLPSPNPMALFREFFGSGYEPSRSVPGTGTSFSASNMTFNFNLSNLK